MGLALADGEAPRETESGRHPVGPASFAKSG
jgi:hypothetical protein